MCILVIRSWPCGHSSLTSSDRCMQSISAPGMTERNCPNAHSVHPAELPTWPCPSCEQFKRLHRQGSVALERAQAWCRSQALEGPHLDFEDDVSSPDDTTTLDRASLRRDSSQSLEPVEGAQSSLHK